MIFDNLSNTGSYSGISPHLDKALMFIENINNVSLSPGRNKIDGDNVFAMMFDYETIDLSMGCYESHQKYIDIQLVLSGSEYIRCLPENAPEITSAYDREGDVELFKLSDGLDLKLFPGRFALFMPGELHAPKLRYSTPSDVRKVVVKVLSI